jgi:hypothetical protein
MAALHGNAGPASSAPCRSRRCTSMTTERGCTA